MEAFVGVFFLEFFSAIVQTIARMDEAYLDIIRIVAGSTAWIGGLTLFMWYREKRKLTTAHERFN